MMIFVWFCALLVMMYCREVEWDELRKKPGSSWLLDGVSLIMQGIVVPLMQTTFLYVLLAQWAPGIRGTLSLGPVASFLLNFVVVDYVYYWNHRLLHGRVLWRWHAVHHTAEKMDVFVTSRNTLWTHFLIVYVWVNALGVFLLKDPTHYILAASLTAMLDLWRHSEVMPKKAGHFYRLLSKALITPYEHAWHHDREKSNCNFGANLNWWDKIHGTYLAPDAYPERLGIELEWTFFQKFLFPFRARNAVRLY